MDGIRRRTRTGRGDTRLGIAAHWLADAAWRTAYRIGFPLARLWWRLTRQRHQGALVAVHVGDALLLVRSSYRRVWSFPGGGLHPNEPPETAARRELAEEIGLVTGAPLRLVGEVTGVWDGRRDHVHMFALRLDVAPALRLDNREIIGARLASLEEARALPLTEPVREYVEGRVGLADPARG